MREALKLALSAIERGETFDYLESVVAPALSKALEAPIQEPVLIVDVGPDYRTSAQDPVVCKHEWFRTGAMEPGECRCIKCGAWNTTTRPAAPIEVSAGPITPEMRWPITPEKRAGLVSAMQGVFSTAPAAPVQEPVKTGDTLFRQFMSEADKAGITHWPTPPAAPVQEPVAYDELTDSQIMASVGRCCAGISESRPIGQQWEMVCELVRHAMRERGYTTPPAAQINSTTLMSSTPAAQRQWVGLTSQDWNVIGFTSEFRAGAEWANDKLKEKNA